MPRVRPVWSFKPQILKDRLGLSGARSGKEIDFGKPDTIVTEDNLKKAYSIDVKLMHFDEDRKICVPLKTNLKLGDIK